LATLRRLDLTEEEHRFLLWLDKAEGRVLTEAEENLALEQARAIGEL